MTEPSDTQAKPFDRNEYKVSTDAASTNFYWTYGKEEQFSLQTTLRGVLSHEEIRAHLETIKDGLMSTVAMGGHAKTQFSKGEAVTTVAPAQPTAADLATGKGPQATPPPVKAGPPANGNGNGAGLSFAADVLELSVNAGKTYFKVKGGQFTKFGVTIWPETLQAAGMDPNSLSPAQTYNMKGWTAHYVTKPDGKPDKIVSLTE